MRALNSISKVRIRTLGCKVNSYESEQILQSLERQGGWRAADQDEVADLCIVNSCTVTAEADRQTRQEIRRLIRQNPDAKIVVTGCYAQMSPDSITSISGVDLVVGNARKLAIPQMIPDLMHQTTESAQVDIADENSLVGLPGQLLTGFSDRARAFLQIQQGCDQGCTFCIIHVARGASQSIPMIQLIEQAEKLVSNGYAELVICGVDLGSWGADLEPETDLVKLLEEMLSISGDFRIRLGSLDPVHISDELISLMAREQRICPHVHLSLQSASTLILKRMKRRYVRESLYERVAAVKARMPQVVFSADVMAGFPTESDEHFSETLQALDDLDIIYPHVFPYSERAGTPAARIPKQVSKDVRNQRARQLREKGREVTNRILGKQVGSSQRVLIENRGKQPGWMRARTDTYLPVMVNDCELVPGQFLNVEIKRVERDHLIGVRSQK